MKGGQADDVNSVHWVGDDRLVFDVVFRNQYAGGLFSVKAGSRRFEVLNKFDALRVIDPVPSDENVVLTRLYSTSRGGPRTVRYFTKRGIGRVVKSAESLPGTQLGWYGDGGGDLIGCRVYHDGKLRLYFRETYESEWRELKRVSEDVGQSFEVLGFDPHERTFWMTAYEDGANTASLFKVPVDPGSETIRVFNDPKYDIRDNAGLLRSKATGQVVGMAYDQKGPTNIWFTEEFDMLQASIDQAFPTSENTIVDFSKGKERLLIHSYSDRSPVSYRVVDIASKNIIFEAHSREWIDSAELHTQFSLNLKMRDGLVLQGYLTLPGAPDAGPYPMVALVHGGPWSRDTWGYDPIVQLLASRGYAVLQLNFRGSSGYGKTISQKYSGDFRDMVLDVTDATRQICERGWADPERLAIMGASFGGYAALAAQVFDPGLFQCSISYAGVFDVAEQIENWGDGFWRKRQGTYAYDYWVKRLGDPEKDAALIEELCPISNASSIQVPVFLAHGRLDRVVDIEQTKDMARALTQAGNKPRTLYLSAEQHGVSSMKNRKKYYDAVLDFLAEHLAE